MRGGDKPIAAGAGVPTPPAASSPEADGTLTASGEQLPPAPPSHDSLPAALTTVPSSYYQIEGEVGRGGVGVVLRAHDRRLSRRVALKQLQHIEPRSRQRFEREMRITAKLQHPGIVPIHEAGVLESGAPFYAMKLIEGRSLKELIADAKTMQERMELLPTVIAVVETIAYAHSQGVIHRDLKPSNVIVGAFGEVVVIDWGLAKDLGAPSIAVPDASLYRRDLGEEMTVAGAVVGTPAYMPPEQARGQEVDKAADVYALGAILRQLVTGKTPYSATSSQAVIDAILVGPPPTLELIAPEAPADLRAVVDKAMARVPLERYSDAAGLLVDLRSFINGRLVSAYSYGASERLRKWASRRRGVVITAFVAILLLLGLGLASYSRVAAERDAALSSRADADEKANSLLREQAARELDQRNAIRAFEILKQYPRDSRDWSKVYPLVNRIGLLGLPDFWTFDAIKGDERTHTGLEPEGRYAVLSRDASIHIWNLDSGTLERVVDFGNGPVSSIACLEVAYVGGNSSVVAGMRDGDLVVMNLRGSTPWHPVRYKACSGTSVSDLAVHRANSVVAIGCSDGQVLALDVETGHSRSLANRPKGRTRVGFLSENLVGSAPSEGGSLVISAVDNGKRVAEFNGNDASLMTPGSNCGEMVVGTTDGHLFAMSSAPSLAVSERYAVDIGSEVVSTGIDDDCRLAFGISSAHRLTVIDLILGRPIFTEAATSASFYPGRSAIVIGTPSGEVEYVEPLTNWRQTWRISMDPIRSALVSQTGTVVAHGDILARFSKTRFPQVLPLSEPAVTMATSPDERTVALGGIEGAVSLLDVEARTLDAKGNVHRGVTLVRAGDDNTIFSVGSQDGCIYAWHTGHEGEPITCVPGGAKDIAVIDASYVSIIAKSGAAIRYDANDAVRLKAIPMPGANRISVTQAKDGLVVGGEHGASFMSRSLEVMDQLTTAVGLGYVGVPIAGHMEGITTNGQVVELHRDGKIRALAKCDGRIRRTWFSASIDSVFATCSDGSTVSWPGVEGVSRVLHMKETTDVDASSDGKVFASSSKDGTILLVDIARRWVTALSSDLPIENLELLPEHNLLISTTLGNGTVEIWDLKAAFTSYPLDDSELFNWLHGNSRERKK